MKKLLLTLTLFLCLGTLPKIARADCPSWTTPQDGFYCNEGDAGGCHAATLCMDPDGNQDYNGDPWESIADLFYATYGYNPDVDEIKYFRYYVIC